MNPRVSILLVEDDVVDVKTVQRAFKANEFAHPLAVVANGAEALAFFFCVTRTRTPRRQRRVPVSSSST